MTPFLLSVLVGMPIALLAIIVAVWLYNDIQPHARPATYLRTLKKRSIVTQVSMCSGMVAASLSIYVTYSLVMYAYVFWACVLLLALYWYVVKIAESDQYFEWVRGAMISHGLRMLHIPLLVYGLLLGKLVDTSAVFADGVIWVLVVVGVYVLLLALNYLFRLPNHLKIAPMVLFLLLTFGFSFFGFFPLWKLGYGYVYVLVALSTMLHIVLIIVDFVLKERSAFLKMAEPPK